MGRRICLGTVLVSLAATASTALASASIANPTGTPSKVPHACSVFTARVADNLAPDLSLDRPFPTATQCRYGLPASEGSTVTVDMALLSDDPGFLRQTVATLSARKVKARPIGNLGNAAECIPFVDRPSNGLPFVNIVAVQRGTLGITFTLDTVSATDPGCGKLELVARLANANLR